MPIPKDRPDLFAELDRQQQVASRTKVERTTSSSVKGITMGLHDLTACEREVVTGCLRAIADGPFISDGDFHPILGFQRPEFSTIVTQSPDLTAAGGLVDLAIQGSMNALLLWFSWQDEDPASASAVLQVWTGARPEEIERIFKKWRSSGGGTTRARIVITPPPISHRCLACATLMAVPKGFRCFPVARRLPGDVSPLRGRRGRPPHHPQFEALVSKKAPRLRPLGRS